MYTSLTIAISRIIARRRAFTPRRGTRVLLSGPTKRTQGTRIWVMSHENKPIIILVLYGLLTISRQRAESGTQRSSRRRWRRRKQAFHSSVLQYSERRASISLSLSLFLSGYGSQSRSSPLSLCNASRILGICEQSEKYLVPSIQSHGCDYRVHAARHVREHACVRVCAGRW
jgi:hypothetical protein